ncbi:probable metal-nicotianamine transporter YSL17 [Phragmites australis]|uniref:probable metal-nicotianamine transporter YSL17 n=1 Tax=Phragmites australis TaxID=29695 RepID=UPI002D76974C|nr:probable metal-nicotianamine transporter YSL17 [Phragmites australis]
MEHDGSSMERAFEAEPLPTLSETITVRSMAVSLVLGTTVSFVAMKLNLTSGFLPSLSIPAALLGFFLARVWIRVIDIFGVSHLPFTRQENTVIQTCVVACSGITYSGGFGTYILGMSGKFASGHVGSDEKNIEEPKIGRLIAFLFLTNFAGLFMIVPLRKVMIIRHRLSYPSGTATAHLINSFHTPHGAKQVRQQVLTLFKSLGGTVLWPLFQWFFAGGKDCGFQVFPTFGITAYRRGFYFDFSTTNVGVGMICPTMITVSMLAGSVLSWGILWPCIETKEGQWYPKNLDANSLSGIMGYKVFIGVSMILADSLFTFLTALVRTVYLLRKRQSRVKTATLAAPPPFQCLSVTERTIQSFDDRRRAQVFLRDRIPGKVAVVAYAALAAVSTAAVPLLYPQLRHHHIALAYLVAPVFAFCNAYGVGVTDMNLSTTYGKIAMLVVSSWVGIEGGGVVAGLVACGIIVAAVSGASDFMQDFKTGYLTLTSPRAMLVGQVVGTALGCVVNPVIFWVFYKVYNMGVLDVADAPYAKVYRGIVMLSVGRHGLPEHSILLCKLFFALALALSAVREAAERRQWRALPYIPSTVGVAVAFFVPPKMPVGMAVGSIALYLWKHADRASERMLSPAVASGLICGDGIGSLMPSMLTFFKAQPPICIKFLSFYENTKLDAFLATHPTS